MRKVEEECGKLLRNREFAVKSALAQSLAVVTDGANPAAFFDSFADKECPRHSVCGAVWKPRSIAYRCLVCEVNPNSAVCVDCFRAGDHAGHDYRIVHTNGGCCDCGSTSAWHASGFCNKHGIKTAADGSPIYQPRLPPAVCDDLDSMLRLVLLRLEEDVTGAMRDGPLQELWSARQLRTRQSDDAPVLVEQPHGRPSGMSDETEQLIRAAQNGDARAVQRAAASGAVLDAKDGSAFQTTALHWAAQGGHVAAVRKLLEAGASVNCTNAYRQTALQCCVFEGHLRTAELLLAHGATPQLEDLVFGSALQIVRNEKPRNHERMLPLLLAAVERAEGAGGASGGGGGGAAASSTEAQDAAGRPSTSVNGAGSSDGGGGGEAKAEPRRKSSRGIRASVASAPSARSTPAVAPPAPAAAPAAAAPAAALPAAAPPPPPAEAKAGAKAEPTIGAAVHLEIARSTLHWLGSLCEHGDSVKQRIAQALLGHPSLLPRLLQLRLQCDRPSPAVIMAIEPLAELDELCYPLLMLPPFKRALTAAMLRIYPTLAGLPAAPDTPDASNAGPTGAPTATPLASTWPPPRPALKSSHSVRPSSFLEAFSVQLLTSTAMVPTLLECGAVPRLLLTLGALFRLTLEPAEQMLRPNMDAAVAAAMSTEAGTEAEGQDEHSAGFYMASRTEDSASAAEALRTWLLFASYDEQVEGYSIWVQSNPEARAAHGADDTYRAAIKKAAALFENGQSLDRLYSPSRLGPGAPLPSAAELSWLACLALNPAGAGSQNDPQCQMSALVAELASRAVALEPSLGRAGASRLEVVRPLDAVNAAQAVADDPALAAAAAGTAAVRAAAVAFVGETAGPPGGAPASAPASASAAAAAAAAASPLVDASATLASASLVTAAASLARSAVRHSVAAGAAEGRGRMNPSYPEPDDLLGGYGDGPLPPFASAFGHSPFGRARRDVARHAAQAHTGFSTVQVQAAAAMSAAAKLAAQRPAATSTSSTPAVEGGGSTHADVPNGAQLLQWHLPNGEAVAAAAHAVLRQLTEEGWLTGADVAPVLRLLLMWLSLPAPDAAPERPATSTAARAREGGRDAFGVIIAAPPSPERPTTVAAAAAAADAAVAIAADADAAVAALSAAATATALAGSPAASPVASRLAANCMETSGLLDQLSAVNDRLVALHEYAASRREGGRPIEGVVFEGVVIEPAARLQRAMDELQRAREELRRAEALQSPLGRGSGPTQSPDPSLQSQSPLAPHSARQLAQRALDAVKWSEWLDEEYDAAAGDGSRAWLVSAEEVP